MNKPWEKDDCADVRAYHTHYPIPVAAALWCGVPVAQVELVVKQCTEVDRAILAHPTIPCIEPRCRAMHEAINNGALECRRSGRQVAPNDHVAPERRTVSREALKNWIAIAFPASKPAFLFDEVERSTHSAINADTFRTLQADRDALNSRLEKSSEAYRAIKHERDALEAERNSLRAMVDKQTTPGDRAETTYLNIIGALLGLLLGKSPSGNPYSSFTSQAAIISALLAHHDDKPGISARTLEDKLAAAKRSLES
ncbi:MAG: cell division protein ZapB [Sulfuricaulis sp.]